jgi:hypothetical protein
VKVYQQWEGLQLNFRTKYLNNRRSSLQCNARSYQPDLDEISYKHRKPTGQNGANGHLKDLQNDIPDL